MRAGGSINVLPDVINPDISPGGVGRSYFVEGV
jgi:hypothetical protein